METTKSPLESGMTGHKIEACSLSLHLKQVCRVSGLLSQFTPLSDTYRV